MHTQDILIEEGGKNQLPQECLSVKKLSFDIV